MSQNCKNCGNRFEGTVCPDCGNVQETKAHKRELAAQKFENGRQSHLTEKERNKNKNALIIMCILGALLATAMVVLPAFLIILGVVAIVDRFIKNPYVAAIMGGLKPGVIGVILATGISLILSNVWVQSAVDYKALAITGVLAVLTVGSRIFRKKKISAIPLIGISALVGIAAGFIF